MSNWWLKVDKNRYVNYNKVFSPIAKYATIWLVCALLAIFDLIINGMNVAVAIFYRILEKNSTWDN